MRTVLQFIKETSNWILAFSGALGVIIGFLGWITLSISDIRNDFKKAVDTVPLVEQHHVFVMNELDYYIDEAVEEIRRGQAPTEIQLERLKYYRDNLKFMTYKQKSSIDGIVFKASKM